MAGTADLADLVRAASPDRHLSVLYAPADRRDALYALYAFDAEVSGLRGRVREPMAGEVRLQWWRDAIAMGAPTGHPVADALIAVVAHHGLPLVAFDNHLEARVFDLYDDPMPSRTDLEGYCGETAGGIFQMAAMILDKGEAPAAATLAGHAGCAQAITALVRLMPLHRTRGQCYIPRDILGSVGLTPEAFVGAADEKTLGGAAAAMLALARDHLQAFRRASRGLPSSLRAAFLPMAGTQGLIETLQRSPPTRGALVDLSPLKRQWLMARHAYAGW